MSRAVALGLLLIVAGALVLRLPRLEERPLHTDEAVHAIKFLGLWEHGTYRYDPHEYHGPILYYATLPFAWLSSRGSAAQLTEATLRLTPVFFGIGLICLLPLLADGLGRGATLASAALTAVSPAMVFYSRYYIHELLLVFFTGLFMAAGWRYLRRPHLGWALLAGLALGLMHTAKETFVFSLASLTAAGALALLWERLGWGASDARTLALVRIPVGEGFPPPAAGGAPRLNAAHLAAALATAVAVSLVLFTSFFTNLSGPLDSLRTYLPWFGRAGGNSPHIHPWYFYFQRLGFFHAAKGPVWSEALILGLALVGFGAAFLPARGSRNSLGGAHAGLVRFLGFYTLVLTTIYGVIPYKTPWCALGFLHGMILLAGVGAVALVGLAQRRWVQVLLGAALVAATAQLAWQAWRTAHPFCADRRNPYVYAHTSKDLFRLLDKVEALAQRHADGRRLLVQVMAPGGDYWPLPWYLRQFNQVGWWPTVPPDPYAPIMIVGAKFDAALDEKSNKKHLMVGLFEMRPRVFFELYVEFDLWRKYVESLPPRRDEE